MHIRPTKILWPTDFSPLAMKAADYARAFAAAFHAELHVLHVAAPLIVGEWPSTFIGAEVPLAPQDVLIPAQARLERLIAEEFDDEEQRIVARVIVGLPWQEICRYARHEQIDLIVMATHGVTGLKHLVMGSTAERVVQHATAPVLTVKSIERDFVGEDEGDTNGRASRGNCEPEPALAR
jgi:nucleotide-binding universal stress UspA family protein